MPKPPAVAVEVVPANPPDLRGKPAATSRRETRAGTSTALSPLTGNPVIQIQSRPPIIIPDVQPTSWLLDYHLIRVAVIPTASPSFQPLRHHPCPAIVVSAAAPSSWPLCRHPGESRDPPRTSIANPTNNAATSEASILGNQQNKCNNGNGTNKTSSGKDSPRHVPVYDVETLNNEAPGRCRIADQQLTFFHFWPSRSLRQCLLSRCTKQESRLRLMLPTLKSA